jgi:hypothetical protein
MFCLCDEKQPHSPTPKDSEQAVNHYLGRSVNANIIPRSLKNRDQEVCGQSPLDQREPYTVVCAIMIRHQADQVAIVCPLIIDVLWMCRITNVAKWYYQGIMAVQTVESQRCFLN